MQSIINAVLGSKKSEGPSKSASISKEEIEKKEQDALTSKSTILKSTDETEALKEIVKETNRLSIEEKPSFKPASKITCVEIPSGDKTKESKKRSYDEIANTEKNAEMTSDVDKKPETNKEGNEEAISPTSSKFNTALGDKLEKKSDEKISPNSKRLKIDESPPKIDQLIKSKDDQKKNDEDANPVVEEFKAPFETATKSIPEEKDKVIETSSSMPKDVEPTKFEAENKSIDPVENQVDTVVETQQTIDVELDQIIPKDKTDIEKATDPIDETNIPHEEKPNSVEQGYLNEVNKISSHAKE